MPHSMITLLLIFLSINVFSNQSKRYISSKHGITIISTGTVEDSIAQQKTLDKYLDFVLTKIDRRDKELNVLILLGHFGIHRRKKDFISVAYNTFERGDTVFIDKENIKSYRAIYNLTGTQNWIFNEMYPYETVDSIYKGRSGQAGLIIRFYGEFDNTTNYYDRVLSILNYAVKNIQLIKQQQQYIRMPYHLKGTTISILTYDTSKLNAIRSETFGFAKNHSAPDKDRKFMMAGVGAVLLLSVAILVARLKWRSQPAA